MMFKCKTSCMMSFHFIWTSFGIFQCWKPCKHLGIDRPFIFNILDGVCFLLIAKDLITLLSNCGNVLLRLFPKGILNVNDTILV